MIRGCSLALSFFSSLSHVGSVGIAVRVEFAGCRQGCLVENIGGKAFVDLVSEKM